jgi:probable HAF family extracellular repeat protein
MPHLRSRCTVVRGALLAALLAAGAATAASPRYSVTDLGDFFATGVNDSGWVTGYSGRALLWRPGVGITDLGDFGPTTGSTANRANAINNAGQVVGYANSPSYAAYRAFLWEEGIGLTDLGDLPRGNNGSRADAINSMGAAAGRAGGQYTNHPTYGNQGFDHAVHFVAPNVLTDLEAHPEGTMRSNARGMNDHGVVVGEREGSFGTRAIVWSVAGGAIDLGALWGVGAPGRPSFAHDVNNQGQVALQLPLAAGGSIAALWQEGIGFTDLGWLPGANNAVTYALNDAGQAVGNAGTFGVAGTRGFLWWATHGLQDLNDLLDPALGAGWLILDANAISEAGLIAGRGWHPSLGYRAILMTPVPEPATTLLLAGGVAALLARRRPGRVAAAA